MSLMEQGAALLGAGRFHEAVQQFGQALRQQPLPAEPRIGLAQACQGTGDGWAATAWLSDACRVAPQRPELWLELAKALAAHKREPELEPLLHAATALHPEHAGLLQMQADLHLRSKRYAQALPLYARLRALQPKDPATLLHYGFCLEHTRALQGAVAAYREALVQREEFLEAHVDLAGVLWRLEDFDGSLAHAQRAVQLAPQHPYAVRVLGTALLNLNRVEEAREQLRHALDCSRGLSSPRSTWHSPSCWRETWRRAGRCTRADGAMQSACRAPRSSASSSNGKAPPSSRPRASASPCTRSRGWAT